MRPSYKRPWISSCWSLLRTSQWRETMYVQFTSCLLITEHIALTETTVLHPARRRTPLVPPHGRSTRNRSSLFVPNSLPLWMKQMLTILITSMGHRKRQRSDHRWNPLPLRETDTTSAATLGCDSVYHSHIFWACHQIGSGALYPWSIGRGYWELGWDCFLL